MYRSHGQGLFGEQSKADLMFCAAGKVNTADAELNAAWKQITDGLKTDPESMKLLVAAQRAWIAFRHAECSYPNSRTLGGSIHPMMVAQCKAGLMHKRIVELKVYLNGEEGGLCCPLLLQ